VVSYQMARNRALQVTAANDTSILLLNPDGTVRASVREGGEAFGPEEGEFSQFTGRAAVGGAFTHFSAAFRPAGGGRALQALFWMSEDGLTKGRTTRQGEALPALGPDLSVRAVTGLSASGDAALFRAAISGPGVSAANNEVIMRGTQLWLRKGVTALEGGLTARRILKFWPVADDRLIAQVQLGGGGVTGRNNSALVNPTQSKPLQDLTAP
jgi:hypothetical protein